jgi:transposase
MHDSQMMGAFLDWDREPLAIVADKAYGSAKSRQRIADEGALAVIPSKSNARKPIPHDPNLYAARNIVERFFCRMKDMRRIATRFEKSAANFRSMLYLRRKMLVQLSPHPNCGIRVGDSLWNYRRDNCCGIGLSAESFLLLE